jgi:hypothetical protein
LELLEDLLLELLLLMLLVSVFLDDTSERVGLTANTYQTTRTTRAIVQHHSYHHLTLKVITLLRPPILARATENPSRKLARTTKKLWMMPGRPRLAVATARSWKKLGRNTMRNWRRRMMTSP